MSNCPTPTNSLQHVTPAHQKWLIVSACLMLLSGAVHIAVWLASGEPWEGAISWRKPILFGISTGVTALSIAWIFPKLVGRRRDRFMIQGLPVALALEVGLITLQQWRGVASHFNHASTLDSVIDLTMTAMICFAAVVIFDITLRSWQSVAAPPDQAIAIRGGLTFLTLSCLIGFALLLHGNQQISVDRQPGIVGDQGVGKFPHGVAIHAIQVFPCIAFWMRLVGVSMPGRVGSLIGQQIAMTGLLLFACWQTINGNPRFDFDIPGFCLLSASTLCFVGSIGYPLLLGKKTQSRVRGANYVTGRQSTRS